MRILVLVLSALLLHAGAVRAETTTESIAPPTLDLEDTGLEPTETEEAYGDFMTIDDGLPSTAPLFDGSAASLLAPRIPIPDRFADSFRLPGAADATEIPSIYNLTIVRNPSVENHIRFFGVAIRDRFEQWLTRLAHYKPLVEEIFTEFNLPSDLVFLSLVESGFNPHAYSRARATGPWQFMKGTAKLYGLRVDRYVDERRDPIKSTIAAARYLRDLYDLFGTWPLAMAAYNAGEGKVMRALEKARAENFWQIARTKHIRRETKEYVPRFMAATIIAKNPDDYGFSASAASFHAFDEVVVHRPVHLMSVATATGISFQELRRLNPELRLDMTPPGDADYHLKVPVGSQATVVAALDHVPTWKPAATVVKTVKNTRPNGTWYKVRVGDTLRSIAARFHTTISDLKAQNRLASRGIKPGDMLVIASAR
ncbi:MAG TPA: transglycosylase SLT domain-containing protein [Nitrospirales bacterium]|nr:transglycosylase SLT domain-containing protein [Nitrospirales bacterium]